MPQIIKHIDREVRKNTVKRCREKNIIIPTFAQLKNPELIPDGIKEELKNVGLWDVNPLNLFRITWKNEPTKFGGGFGEVNFLEIPPEITGIKARVVGLVGKFFPTGAHKVGAAFGCLVPRLVSGEFDPTRDKAVWPSTGNYCRGGAFDSVLLGCTPVAILPEEMSTERFTWLREIGSEVIATPGCESNVKEIYDKCWELREDPKNVIFNQFDEFGNPIYHYNITGSAIEEVFEKFIKKGREKLSAYVSATGSAGTIAAGDYLKTKYPKMLTIASEALQCPTILENGFGGHRIEGIGDKHIPWVHNVMNTDAGVAIDDEDCMRVMQLFNEKAGQEFLKGKGVSDEVIDKLELLGISSISNLLSAIKTAKYYEMGEDDVIFTVFTDSMEMYQSRLEEELVKKGKYTAIRAAVDFEGCLVQQDIENFLELGYRDRKRVHNLKYYTWVEQQGKTYEEILAQWNEEYWRSLFEDEIGYFDQLIKEFNLEVGLLEKYEK
ncbi:MAG: pyridoxal-phosphate dependent enzyme [Candidatus Cloacimonadales bacterium]|nr:pyridoxal-phosphate dependent enzyme [Candidatus Cloacimonadales bacterium]